MVAVRVMFNLLMVRQITMEELKYALVVCGAQYVMTGGMSEMLQLPVDNWDIMEVSL